MLTFQYFTEAEKDTIIAQQEALGNKLAETQHLYNGNFVVFQDDQGINTFNDSLENDPIIQGIQSASFAAINNYIDNNITSLADAKVLFKKLVICVVFLLRRELK